MDKNRLPETGSKVAHPLVRDISCSEAGEIPAHPKQLRSCCTKRFRSMRRATSSRHTWKHCRTFGLVSAWASPAWRRCRRLRRRAPPPPQCAPQVPGPSPGPPRQRRCEAQLTGPTNRTASTATDTDKGAESRTFGQLGFVSGAVNLSGTKHIASLNLASTSSSLYSSAFSKKLATLF